jgi:hypothetical protein
MIYVSLKKAGAFFLGGAQPFLLCWGWGQVCEFHHLYTALSKFPLFACKTNIYKYKPRLGDIIGASFSSTLFFIHDQS